MKQPIGIFDSGLGGLTVLKEVLSQTQNTPIVYFGDTARVPYGTKSKETITRFSIENTVFLKQFNVQAVVVACHTASSLALEELQNTFMLPIVGVVEPGAKKAIEVTKNNHIGIIGTKSTIQSKSYEKELHKINPSIQVTGISCPLFVPLIEEGWTDGKIVSEIIDHYLNPLVEQNIDTLILGCTHYPILIDKIKEALPENVQIINPAKETSKLLKNILKEDSSGEPLDSDGLVEYFVSDEAENFRVLGERFLGMPIKNVKKITEQKVQVV